MKTKVIAFRVTQQEYDGLNLLASQRLMKVSEFVNDCLSGAIHEGFAALRKEEKRVEAKAKREAKKVAGNVSE